MKYKILIVDDNYADFTKDLLEIDIDATFDLAYNGLEGFSKFQQNHNSDNQYSLVIMDINMPIMDGIDSIKKIREIDEQTPIIVHSSMRITQIINEAMGSGANAFIEKGGALAKESKFWLELDKN